MAILATISKQIPGFSGTVEASGAYVKVASISGDKYEITALVSAVVSGTQVLSQSYRFAPEMESPDNFIKQVYLYLKTLPEFADAVDC